MPTLLRELHRMLGSQGARALPDAQLLDRFIHQQDEAAFEVMVWRHGPMVWNVCQRVLRHRQEAEDAFQATFLLFVRKARSISKRESLAGWLYKVAYRVALRARKNLSKRERLSAVSAEEHPCSLMEDAAMRELRGILDEEVAALPERYRTPTILCYFEGKSYAEAARELNCPKGTVSIRLTRAREMLRARLTRRGFALSAAALVGEMSADQVAARVPISLVRSAISEGAVRLVEGALKAMFLTRLKLVAVTTLVLAVLGISTGWWAYAQAPAEAQAPPRVSQGVSRPKPPPPQRPLGNWQREVGPYRVTLRVEKDRLFGNLTSKELKASLEADYSVTRDNVLYGVVTALEHVSFASMRGYIIRGAGPEIQGEPVQVQLHGYKAPDLVDQPFSIRYRLDDESLTLKGFKFMGGEGGKFADVIQGRYTKAPALRPKQATKSGDPPDEATVLRALGGLKSWRHIKSKSEIQIVTEPLTDRVDPVRSYPLVGPARLHHCHWKCTVYFKDEADQSRVEVVYIDKDHLEPAPDR